MRPSNEISRVATTRQQSAAFYDRISGWYDLLASSEQRATRLGVKMLAVQPGERVLEVGSGSGRTLTELADAAGDAGVACGIDLSPRMLAISHSRKQAAGSHACPVCADAVLLPLASQSFDVAFMSFVLELFDTPEIPLVLEECRRVLRPSGRLGVVALSRAGGLPAMGRLYEWGHAHLPALLDCRLIVPARSLTAAGYEIRETMSVSLFGLPVDIVLACAPPTAV
jgi:ubiquinone/menaquinone biosynthesis C-methylase UbiE